MFRPILVGFALFSADNGWYVGEAAQKAGFLRRETRYAPFVRSVTAPVPPAHEDQQLVAAMTRADERAAATLYDKYSASMFALAVRMVGEGADAEDVVLDVFTQAWNSAGLYDTSRGSVLGWLTTMTRTRALDFIRARGRRAKAVEKASHSMGDEPVAVAAAAASVADRVELDERAATVTAAMSVLSGQQRNAIELAFFEGLTHSEIATRLDEPLGTIKTRIRLGMQKLRDVLRSAPQEMGS